MNKKLIFTLYIFLFSFSLCFSHGVSYPGNRVITPKYAFGAYNCSNAFVFNVNTKDRRIIVISVKPKNNFKDLTLENLNFSLLDGLMFINLSHKLIKKNEYVIRFSLPENFISNNLRLSVSATSNVENFTLFTPPNYAKSSPNLNEKKPIKFIKDILFLRNLITVNELYKLSPKHLTKQ
jgi:hypothetical protein